MPFHCMVFLLAPVEEGSIEVGDLKHYSTDIDRESL